MSDNTLSCMFCLDEHTYENPVFCLNFAKEKQVPCNCRLYTHPDCWMIYYIKKCGFECPICHTKIISERTLSIHTNCNVYTVTVKVDVEQPIHITLPPPPIGTLSYIADYLPSRGCSFALSIVLLIGIVVIICLPHRV